MNPIPPADKQSAIFNQVNSSSKLNQNHIHHPPKIQNIFVQQTFQSHHQKLVKVEQCPFQPANLHTLDTAIRKQRKASNKKQKTKQVGKSKRRDKLHWKVARNLRKKVFYDVKKLSVMNSYLRSKTQNTSQIKQKYTGTLNLKSNQFKKCYEKCEKLLLTLNGLKQAQTQINNIQQISCVEQILSSVSQIRNKVRSEELQQNERTLNKKQTKRRGGLKDEIYKQANGQYLLTWCHDEQLKLITILSEMKIHPYYTALWKNIFGDEEILNKSKRNQNDSKTIDIRLSNSNSLNSDFSMMIYMDRMKQGKQEKISQNQNFINNSSQIDYEQISHAWRESMLSQLMSHHQNISESSQDS